MAAATAGTPPFPLQHPLPTPAAPPDEIAPRLTGSGPRDEGGERPRQPPGGVRVPAEEQMGLDQLQFHEHQAIVPLHAVQDRKSTRLNSSHSQISYAGFCLKKK